MNSAASLKRSLVTGNKEKPSHAVIGEGHGRWEELGSTIERHGRE
ncbi:MAG TPA: hypothetical protein PK127_07055 [Clostridiales bacterium]|nr:hypothetical protein [Clostridiales bacterium]HPV02218.1 hypothetical protein [Clostridiales bacterium]